MGDDATLCHTTVILLQFVTICLPSCAIEGGKLV